MSALRKLADTLQRALAGSAGALDAKAPEFLDFLVGQSPADRQQLYRAGLDALNAESKKRYNKTFAGARCNPGGRHHGAPARALVLRTPDDPLTRFLHTAKADIRTATVNSREYNTSGATSAGRGPPLRRARPLLALTPTSHDSHRLSLDAAGTSACAT